MFPHNFNLLSKFYLWSIGAMFVIFGTVFSIYVHFEIETDIANDERIKSHELSDELAKSSDDLTLMVRSYVATRDLAICQQSG